MKKIKSIKKNVSKVALVLLGVIFISTNFSCEDNLGCDTVADYSDLLTSLVDVTSGFIDVGDDIVIANQITNEGIRNVCDILSLTAPESVYSLDFDYRPDPNSGWVTSAARALISVDEIAPNSSSLENFNFVFQQGGQYRISGKADAQEEVIERNENNNTKEFVQSRSINQAQSNLIINVSNTSRKAFNEEEQIIKVDFSKNPNLISFQCLTIKEASKN